MGGSQLTPQTRAVEGLGSFACEGPLQAAQSRRGNISRGKSSSTRKLGSVMQTHGASRADSHHIRMA